MKRERVWAYLLSDGNLGTAIDEVNQTHLWLPHHRPNKTVAWVAETREERIRELREMIRAGFQPSPAKKKRRWDKSAGKWRDIWEPRLWPDQYVHHAVVQALQKVMMRGMDPWCCGSIRKRGIHYGVKALKKWMRNDPKGTRWCAELDIRHFYESLRPEVVMGRLRKLVKDRMTLGLAERLLEGGVMIGAYFSQWFANTVLQELDHALRQSGLRVKHYIRYMDNFTVFASSKRTLDKAIRLVQDWLRERGMKLKDNWQKFRTADRLPSALGYRFGKGFSLLRKKNLFRIRRQLGSYYRKLKRGVTVPASLAFGLLSRLGQMKHCSSVKLRERMVKPKTQKGLKQIVRCYMRKERAKWSTYSVPLRAAAIPASA